MIANVALDVLVLFEPLPGKDAVAKIDFLLAPTHSKEVQTDRQSHLIPQDLGIWLCCPLWQYQQCNLLVYDCGSNYVHLHSTAVGCEGQHCRFCLLEQSTVLAVVNTNTSLAGKPSPPLCRLDNHSLFAQFV